MDKKSNYTPPKKHTALFYNSKDELLEVLVPYFKTGLENNEFCIWITADLLKPEEAKSELGKAVKNLDAYIEKKQIEIGSPKDYYFKTEVFTASGMLEYWVNKEKEVLEQGFNGIRLSGNGDWGLGEYWPSLSFYEKEVNKIINEHKITAICTYCINKLELQQLFDVGTSHQSSLCKRMGQWDNIEPSRFAMLTTI